MMLDLDFAEARAVIKESIQARAVRSTKTGRGYKQSARHSKELLVVYLAHAACNIARARNVPPCACSAQVVAVPRAQYIDGAMVFLLCVCVACIGAPATTKTSF